MTSATNAEAVIGAIKADNASKVKRTSPTVDFSCALYAFTAIDNDYGPPFVDTVIADDYSQGLEKLKSSLAGFYEEQAKWRKEEFKQDVAIPTFNWQDIDAQITRSGFYRTDDDRVLVFVKRFNLKQETRHFIE